MKLVNFASLDPVQQKRGIKGLSNVSDLDRKVWDEFHQDWEAKISESEETFKKYSRAKAAGLSEINMDRFEMKHDGSTERIGAAKVRLVQRVFRIMVLTSYSNTCAMCGLNVRALLIASHIVPWSDIERLRADPRNGLSLCVLHDRAFDRGMITIDENLDICLSKILLKDAESEMHRVAFLNIEGKKLNMPERFAPYKTALAYHRDNIFKN